MKIDAEYVLGDRYRFGQPLAGTSERPVWAAVDEWSDEAVLLVLVPGSADSGSHSATIRRRVGREVRIATGLRSPRLRQVLDVVTDESGLWVASRARSNARTLHEVLDSDAAPGSARLARWGRDVADGLAELHTAGLVHRDVRPGLVAVDDDGSACLLGVAATADLDTEPDAGAPGDESTDDAPTRDVVALVAMLRTVLEATPAPGSADPADPQEQEDRNRVENLAALLERHESAGAPTAGRLRDELARAIGTQPTYIGPAAEEAPASPQLPADEHPDRTVRVERSGSDHEDHEDREDREDPGAHDGPTVRVGRTAAGVGPTTGATGAPAPRPLPASMTTTPPAPAGPPHVPARPGPGPSPYRTPGPFDPPPGPRPPGPGQPNGPGPRDQVLAPQGWPPPGRTESAEATTRSPRTRGRDWTARHRVLVTVASVLGALVVIAALALAGTTALETTGRPEPTAPAPGGSPAPPSAPVAAAPTDTTPASVVGDARSANPCSLLSTAAFTRFGSARLLDDYGPFGSCAVQISTPGGGNVVTTAGFFAPGELLPTTADERVGAIGVTRPAAATPQRCRRVLSLPDGSFVEVETRAITAVTGADPCTVADAGTSTALPVLLSQNVGRRAPDPALQLGSLDACSLVDAGATARIAGLDGTRRIRWFGGWGCSVGYNPAFASAPYVNVEFSRLAPLEGTPTRIGRHAAVVTTTPASSTGRSSCDVYLVQRSYTGGSSGQARAEVARVNLVGSVDDPCGAATAAATAVETRLPPPV